MLAGSTRFAFPTTVYNNGAYLMQKYEEMKDLHFTMFHNDKQV